MTACFYPFSLTFFYQFSINLIVLCLIQAIEKKAITKEKKTIYWHAKRGRVCSFENVSRNTSKMKKTILKIVRTLKTF